MFKALNGLAWIVEHRPGPQEEAESRMMAEESIRESVRRWTKGRLRWQQSQTTFR